MSNNLTTQLGPVPNRPSWSFSVLLLAVYLLTFHAWLLLPELWVAITGWSIPTVLGAAAFHAWRRASFANRLDLFSHVVVILDLWIEGVWVRLHEGWSFYACAAAFAAVIGGYRAWIVSQSAIVPGMQTPPTPVQ